MSLTKDNSFTSGMNAFRDKQYSEAIDYFFREIRENPDNHRAYNALGVTQTKTGDTIGAEICFQKALLLDPSNATYKKNLEKIRAVISPVNEPGVKPDRKKTDVRGSHHILTGAILFISIITGILFLFTGSILQTGTDFSWTGTTDGLLDSLKNPLILEERIYPEATITVKDKKIVFRFDNDQDLSQITELHSTVRIEDGSEFDLPVISTPQKGVYYGFDDPFYGKKKVFILTGQYKDKTDVNLFEKELGPR